MEDTKWVVTQVIQHRLCRETYVLGIFNSHADAVTAVESEAGEQDWQIKEDENAPGDYKAILSCFLHYMNCAIVICPFAVGKEWHIEHFPMDAEVEIWI